MNKKNNFFNHTVPISAGVFLLEQKPIHLIPKHLMTVTVLSGSLAITLANREAVYKEGETALVPCDTPVSIQTSGKNTNVLIIGIDPVHYRDQFPHIDSAIFDKSNQERIKNSCLYSLILHLPWQKEIRNHIQL